MYREHLHPENRVDLAGTWDLAIASDSLSPVPVVDIDIDSISESHVDLSPRIRQELFASSSYVELPGALQNQGFGVPVTPDTAWVETRHDNAWYVDERFEPYRKPGATKYLYHLQPMRRYIGPAWYRRKVHIPESWADRRVVLFLERPHWQTRAWFDGRYLGSNDSLATPHEYSLGSDLEPGSHEILLCVDNRVRINIGPNSHSISDHTQGNWNGVVGAIQLYATPRRRIEDVGVYPHPSRDVLTVDIRVRDDEPVPAGPASEEASQEEVDVYVYPPGEDTALVRQRALLYPEDEGVRRAVGELQVSLPRWDEFSPSVVELRVVLPPQQQEGPPGEHDEAGRKRTPEPGTSASPPDEVRLTTGLRSVRARARRLEVNGRAVMLRGTVESCVFPDTGYPPTDDEHWRRIMRRAKEWGLNHLRFHSWCPPDAAFRAADREGLYLQVECPTWPSDGASVGEDPTFDAWLFAETRRILRSYGNHPSFIMFSAGNEPAGRLESFLGSWVAYCRSIDDRRLYTAGSGWPELPENDYHCTPRPRLQQWGEGRRSRINREQPSTLPDYRALVRAAEVPLIAHEIGQWCSYPDRTRIDDLTGFLRPRNYEIIAELFDAAQLGLSYAQVYAASGYQQLLCYKEEIETALRTPEFGGFQLLALTDFPGQGTAPVGVLSYTWKSKGYVDAATFRRFCSPIVALARLPRRTLRVGDKVRAELEIAHYGAEDLRKVTLSWRLVATGTIAEDRFALESVAAGELHGVGTARFEVPAAAENRRCVFTVTLSRGDHVITENAWDLWVFSPAVPDDESAAGGTRSAEHPVPARTAALPAAGRAHGGPAHSIEELISRADGQERLLVMIPPQRVRTDVKLGFSTVFWNTAWTGGQGPHTLGLVNDLTHPLFRYFPTGPFSDWHWWEIVRFASAMELDAFPRELRVPVAPVDTWFRMRRLGLIFEARFAGTSVIVCSCDLDTDIEARPAAQRFREALELYLHSDDFRPEASLDEWQLRLLTE